MGRSARHNGEPVRMIWWAVLAIAVIVALLVRAVLSNLVDEPVAIGVGVGAGALVLLALRKRTLWRPVPAPERDEQQVAGQRRHLAGHYGGQYQPAEQDIDPGIGRLVLLADGHAQTCRQRASGTYADRPFSCASWQVIINRRPTKSRSHPALQRAQVHEVIVLQTRTSLPPVWLWGRGYFSNLRWIGEFPLQGHGRNPLRVVRRQNTKGASLPEHWPALEVITAPFVEALNPMATLLGAGGYQVFLRWVGDASVAATQHRLALAHSFADAMEHAVRQGQLPVGHPEPAGPG